MGRGVSSGGGQSSLGYLFGSGEPPKAAGNREEAPRNAAAPVESKTVSQKPTAVAPPATVDVAKQAPAGVPGSKANYSRSEGQNSGNFLTDRPSTKVAAAPGGGSSLDYLFGGGSK